MTTNKVKQVILATTMSLLSLVILIPPGISAQMITGESEECNRYCIGVVDEIMALETVIQRYKNDLIKEEDRTRQKITENIIDRLEIAKAIHRSANGHEVDGKYADMTLEELLALLDETNPEDFVESSSGVYGHSVGNAVGMAVTHSRGTSIDVQRTNTHVQSDYDCEESEMVTGTAQSTLSSHTDGSATVSGTFEYPEDFDQNVRERRTTTCYDFDHYETVKRHDVLAAAIPGGGEAPGQVCTLRADSASDEASVGCNAFGPDRMTLITATNAYDSDETSRDVQLGGRR